MEILDGAAAVREAVGRELGPGEWCDVDQSRVDGFAEVTEDLQWIHVDPERAASGPFGAAIAHGFLTLSLIPHLAASARRFEGARVGVNYGLNRVRFPRPVRCGERVRARVTITEVDELDDGALQVVSRVTIEVDGADKPACVADLVSRSYF